MAFKEGGLIGRHCQRVIAVCFPDGLQRKRIFGGLAVVRGQQSAIGQHYSFGGIAMAYSFRPQAMVYYPADDIYVDGNFLGIG